MAESATVAEPVSELVTGVAAGAIDWVAAEAEAVELFKGLLRLDTTNPPGNEKPAAELLAESLRRDGIEPVVLESAPGRANLVARLKGDGSGGGPVLLNAHLDVVPVEAGKWTHPPFAAEEHGGWIYGRGAVDMKHMAAMGAMVLKLAARAKLPLKRDLIFCAVADEENGSNFGAKWLVREHADLVKCEYALGEAGGFTLRMGEQAFYPIQVAQKGFAWMKMRATGTPGHGSIPRSDTAVVRLAEALVRVGKLRLPIHVTPVVRRFLRAMAEHLPAPRRFALNGLTQPRLAPQLLKMMPDRSQARSLTAMLSNTATPTGLSAGSRPNVIPGEAEATLDGRTLPGSTVDDLLAELRAAAGPGMEFEVFSSQPPVEASIETPLYRALTAALGRAAPGAIAVPMMITGFTDAYAFTENGAIFYGFAPVQLPPDAGVTFWDLFHGHDERIPVDGFKWGLRTLHDAVTTFCA